MNRGILFALTIALVVSSLACRHPVDPAQVATVDSLMKAMDAANFTLNELNLDHYHKASVLLEADGNKFHSSFTDTLDRNTATRLAEHFNNLREAAHMAEDHQHVQDAAEAAALRLRALRTDLQAGSMDPEAALRALRIEQGTAEELDQLVQQVIANYKTTQRVLAEHPNVDSLMANLPKSRNRR